MRIVNLLVVNMISVKLLLVIAKLHGLDSNDFMLAFPQAELDVDIGWSYPSVLLQKTASKTTDNTCSNSTKTFVNLSRRHTTGGMRNLKMVSSTEVSNHQT